MNCGYRHSQHPPRELIVAAPATTLILLNACSDSKSYQKGQAAAPFTQRAKRVGVGMRADTITLIHCRFVAYSAAKQFLLLVYRIYQCDLRRKNARGYSILRIRDNERAKNPRICY